MATFTVCPAASAETTTFRTSEREIISCSLRAIPHLYQSILAIWCHAVLLGAGKKAKITKNQLINLSQCRKSAKNYLKKDQNYPKLKRSNRTHSSAQHLPNVV
jgi:hypothetical protein